MHLPLLLAHASTALLRRADASRDASQAPARARRCLAAMPRQKQQAPTRGGAYARNAASRARAANAARREADEDDVAVGAGADEARPARRRRVEAATHVALHSHLAALHGARRVGALQLTWHGAPVTPATISALRVADDDDSDSDADMTAPCTADAAAGAAGVDAGRTPFVALACGGGAGDAPPLRGALGAPRSVAEAVATLVASGAAAAALSPDCSLLRVALLPAAFEDAPASPIEAGASAVHAALRAALPFLLSGGAPPRTGFDPAALFALLRREGRPALAPRLRGLRPTLRPYQARAAAWLVARETGAESAQWPPGATHPLWQRVASPPDADDDGARIETTPHGAPAPPECSSSSCNAFFFCAATGRLALAPFPPPALPRGGILADEMGLGKTVELLALVCANRFTPSSDDDDVADAAADPDGAGIDSADASGPPWLGERVACACGEDPEHFEGTWVQCGACLGWSHAPCVDYRPPPRRKRARNAEEEADDPADSLDFECGRCRAWRAAAPLRSRCGATLVVCPASLVEQWRRELLRHIGNDDDDDGMPALRVRVYSGQSQAAGGPGGHGASVVTAAELGSYDVVITSYDVLRGELHRGSDDADASASAQFGRASRRGGEGSKRYSIVPTPLTRLTWWRLVCDEAQAVESSAAAATAMARRLRASHRWCVTGTPVCRGGADDVHGLLTFLEAAPLADVALWRAAVGRRVAAGDGAGAAYALAACISPLFWRTSREEAAAAGELQLPPQGSLLTWLALSPLERHWYAAQHSRCAADAARALRGGGSDALARDAPLPHQQLQAVLRGPLLRLRQACDHPQVGAGGITGGAGGGVLTMSEIHARLEEKARNEAEEAQRALAMGLNALAGLALIRSDAPAAAHLYRTVLALEDRPSVEADAAGPDAAPQNPGDGLRLDALQRLHALRNLDAALAATSSAASAAAGSGRIAEERLALARDADVIAEAYLAPHVARAASAARDLARASRAADPSALPAGADGWWLAALGRAARASDGGSALAQRLRDAVQERWQDAAVPFTSCAGAQAALTASLRDIGAARRELLATAAALERATSAASAADVWAAGHCGACRGGAGVASVRCRHCVAAEGPVAAAENALFGRQIKASLPGRHVEEADVGAGRSAPSSAETCLRALAGWVARSDGCADLADAARAHLEQLEAMRREFAKASAAMLAQRIALAARDELDMAGTRLRLRTEAEAAAIGRDPVAVHLRLSVLHPHEAVAAEAAAREARGGHEAALAAARAQLRWLRSLKQRDAAADAADAEGAAGTADDVCPVCHDALRAGHTSVLPCGHALCVRCTLYMAGRARGAAATAAAAAVPPARAAAAPPPPPVRLSCPKCRKTAPSDQIFTVAAASEARPSTDHAAADVAAPASGVLSVAGTCPGRPAGDPASAAARAFAEAVAAEEGRVRVQGAWGTKLDAVVRRILFLCQREPGCKVRRLFVSFSDLF